MTLAGVWINEYGSKMDLAVYSDKVIFGTYMSSTGSTGKYMVTGYQQAADPTSSSGQAVALAIEWHSIVAGPGDPSWHWSSGLSGQISIKDSAESLVLAHAMVATDDFPNLANTGIYIDKLTYKRASEQQSEEQSKPYWSSPLDGSIAGLWRTGDGIELTIELYPYPGSPFAWIQGKMNMKGTTCEISGVTDTNASADGLQLQSAAITAVLNPLAGPAIAFAGSLDLKNGQLTLLDLQTQSTSPDATYVQTQISTKTFVRTPAH